MSQEQSKKSAETGGCQKPATVTEGVRAGSSICVHMVFSAIPVRETDTHAHTLTEPHMCIHTHIVTHKGKYTRTQRQTETQKHRHRDSVQSGILHAGRRKNTKILTYIPRLMKPEGFSTLSYGSYGGREIPVDRDKKTKQRKVHEITPRENLHSA